MTKIRNLNNSELLKNIEKYQKLLTGLHKERARRVKVEPASKKELFTKQELAEMGSTTSQPSGQTQTKAQPENKTLTSIPTVESDGMFHINFEDSEIQQMDEKEAQEKKDAQEEEDGVQMTEVLQLTQEQLKEFNTKRKEKIEKKKKK